MKNLKKISSFFFSMKFAMIILFIFVLACLGGSVIPQGEITAVYEKAYPSTSNLILALGLNDVFHSWWFALLTLVLCMNLLGCNLIHFPQIMNQTKQGPKAPVGEFLLYQGDQEQLFREMGFRKSQKNGAFIYGVRNKIGLWGSWLTHLGILIIIIGFAMGQIYTVKNTVYGVPGEECRIGQTEYKLIIDDFQVALREDDTVEQYTAALTVTNLSSLESWSGVSSVNHPWDVQGMRLYQNSMGWAADVVVFEGEEILQREILCVGEYFAVKDRPDLLVSFRSFYPDYVLSESGMPATASDRMVNPGYLYALYYHDQVLGMNVLREGEKITVSDYTIVFANPRYYTLIQIKSDPFTWLAGIGSAILLVALFIAFYMRMEELWLVPESDGVWRVYGKSRKGSILFRDKLASVIEKNNGGSR